MTEKVKLENLLPQTQINLPKAPEPLALGLQYNFPMIFPEYIFCTTQHIQIIRVEK
jgi:hypothetical protein